MPRAELEALYRTVKSLDLVLNELNLEGVYTQLWTDNRGVVDQLKSKKTLERFVQNRVQRIRKYPVKHVSGITNPADLASRGCDPVEILSNKSWWEGPPWLSMSEAQFPECVAEYRPEERESLEDEFFREDHFLFRGEHPASS
jgi:hypothetical protein